MELVLLFLLFSEQTVELCNYMKNLEALRLSGSQGLGSLDEVDFYGYNDDIILSSLSLGYGAVNERLPYRNSY